MRIPTGVGVLIAGIVLAGCASTVDGSATADTEQTDATSSTSSTTAPPTTTGVENWAGSDELARLTCGELYAKGAAEQEAAVNELARRRGKPQVYNNPNGWKLVVGLCGTSDDDLVIDSMFFL